MTEITMMRSPPGFICSDAAANGREKFHECLSRFADHMAGAKASSGFGNPPIISPILPAENANPSGESGEGPAEGGDPAEEAPTRRSEWTLPKFEPPQVGTWLFHQRVEPDIFGEAKPSANTPEPVK